MDALPGKPAAQAWRPSVYGPTGKGLTAFEMGIVALMLAVFAGGVSAKYQQLRLDRSTASDPEFLAAAYRQGFSVGTRDLVLTSFVDLTCVRPRGEDCGQAPGAQGVNVVVVPASGLPSQDR